MGSPVYFIVVSYWCASYVSGGGIRGLGLCERGMIGLKFFIIRVGFKDGRGRM
jgi:hypothetical protein